MKVKRILTILLASMMVFASLCLSVNAETAETGENETVASVGNAEYKTVTEAVNEAGGGTVTLLKDTVESVTVEGASVKATIDLNGKTLTSTASKKALDIQNGAEVTVCDGTETKAGKIVGVDEIAVNVKNSTLKLQSGTIEGKKTAVQVWGGNLEIIGGTIRNTEGVNGGAILVYSDETVTPHNKANVKMTGGRLEGTRALSGNGTDSFDEADVTIEGDAVIDISKTDVAIYWPSNGTLTFGGNAKITAGTGIYQKSGTLNITGGTIEAKAVPNDKGYVPNGSGCWYSGDAVSIENWATGGYDPITVNITGGTFKSDKGHAVKCYEYYTDTYEAPLVKNFISGGNFSEEIPDSYCKKGYVAKAKGDGTYDVTFENFKTQTDAGYYLDGDTKLGLMRWLFNVNLEGDIENVEIRYLYSKDITGNCAATVNGGNVSAFYGDVVGVPENTTGTYYAVGYVKMKNGGEYWTDPVGCTPNFTKHFTSLDKTGGAE